MTIYPAKHFTTGRIDVEHGIKTILEELGAQVAKFEHEGKLVEAQRLKQRTQYDMEMLRETGYVSGIENYSRILEGRDPGTRPSCLLDFFKPPFLAIIDESHVTVPQIGGMYNGDFARKTTLVEHGFRIPAALDNRPLKFPEFENLTDFVIYSSATPADYELKKSGGIVVEQIIRPTGLVDPPVEVLPASNQVDDLTGQLRKVTSRGERALVTTLTKKMAENLTEYLLGLDFKVKYLHSDIETLERTDILRELRSGVFDVLIGINLLREGLDLPEVTLVAILDADKEGFLRSTRSLIQTAGRAARNVNGRIILYADTITDSIRKTLSETNRRRKIQLAHNKKHGITPKSVSRPVPEKMSEFESKSDSRYPVAANEEYDYSAVAESLDGIEAKDVDAIIRQLHNQMKDAAKNLKFEKAAQLRDRIAALKKRHGY
jgi:excinuclease ABC subunit B